MVGATKPKPRDKEKSKNIQKLEKYLPLLNSASDKKNFVAKVTELFQEKPRHAEAIQKDHVRYARLLKLVISQINARSGSENLSMDDREWYKEVITSYLRLRVSLEGKIGFSIANDIDSTYEITFARMLLTILRAFREGNIINYIGKCEHCKMLMTKSRVDQKTCSKKCKTALYRKKRREGQDLLEDIV